MGASVTYPVQVLREHLTELEAAMVVCLDNPDVRPVHRLRTETRRVEALLSLLALVPGLPEHREEAAALLRVLARLRRAAGDVRDLDVHRKMLESLVDSREEDQTPSSEKRRAKKLSWNAADLGKSAKDLRHHLGGQRDKAAVGLKKLLRKRQTKTAGAAEALLDALEPAKDLALQAQDVLRDAGSVLTREGRLQPGAIAALSEKDLHKARKAAKAARYIAESVGDDPALSEAARAFESLQDAGGQWHDTLELARAARRWFGKDHPLVEFYRGERNRKLDAYRAALQKRASVNAPGRKPIQRFTSRRTAAA